MKKLIAAVFALLMLMFVAAPAQASVPTTIPRACVSEDPYHYSSVTTSRLSAVPTVYGDPGVTVSIAIYAGMSVTATVTGSVSGEVSIIVAHADTQLALSMSVSLTAAVTYTGSYAIPKTAPNYGYLGAGAQSKNMAWSHGYYVGCTWHYDRYGNLNGPYHLPYFWRGVK
jgi:hypothetical protein